MNANLTVSKRDTKENAQAVRAAGAVPGVVYGPKQEPIAIAVDGQLFEKTMREASESTILTLTGLDEEVEVLIQDVSFDAARGGASHVDFYAIERGKELTTNVPLEFIGEAPAEKAGATVTKVLFDVEVTCRPSKLPAQIEVDLTTLAGEGDQINVGNLPKLDGVTYSAAPEEVIATVSAARDTSDDEATEAPDMAEIEVEEKGKGEAAEGGEDSNS